MITKKNSIMSKGWLIIGIVLLVTGLCLLFLANSLYFESNQLEEFTEEEFNGDIKEIQDHIETNARFLVIAAIIIIITGTVMMIEWALFSSFLKKALGK